MSHDGKVRFDLKQVAQMDRQIQQQKSHHKQHNSKNEADQSTFINIKKEKKGPNLFDLIQQEEAENDDVVGIQAPKRHRSSASQQQSSLVDVTSVLPTISDGKDASPSEEDSGNEEEAESFESTCDEDNSANAMILRQALSRTIFIFDSSVQEKQSKHVVPPLRTVVLSNRSTATNRSSSIPNRLSVSETFPLPLLQRLKNLDINALAEKQRQVREKQRLLMLEKERKEKEAAEKKKAEEKKIPKIDSIYDDEDVGSVPYELFSRNTVLKALNKDEEQEESSKENKQSAEWSLHPKYVPIVTFSRKSQTSVNSTSQISQGAKDNLSLQTEAGRNNDSNDGAKHERELNNASLQEQTAEATSSTSTTMAATILKFVRPLRPLPILKSTEAITTDVNSAETTMTVNESWLHRMDPILRIIRNAQQERQQSLLAIHDTKMGAANRKAKAQAGIVGSMNVFSALAEANKNFSKENVIHRDIFGVSNDIKQAEEQERKAKRAKSKQGDAFGIDTNKTSLHNYMDFDNNKDNKGDGDEEENDEENGLLSSSMQILGKDAVLMYGGDDSDIDDDGSDYGGGKRKLGSGAGRGGNGGRKRMKTG